jgi:hypothetical protein
MTLYFKRAKCFVHSDEGTKKFLAQPGPNPLPVPFWVAQTATFKQGIKDKSIINLTPPEQMPGYVPAPAAVAADDADEPETPEQTPENGGKGYDEDDDLEQKEVPQAPFGAQPMTPVQPGPKIGSVRTAGGRGGNK